MDDIVYIYYTIIIHIHTMRLTIITIIAIILDHNTMQVSCLAHVTCKMPSYQSENTQQIEFTSIGG